MPRLFKFAEEHKADADKFVILTFHQGQAEKSLDACKPQFEKLQKSVWKIDKFPFPILMDASGQTVKNYKIRGFPTGALIDPDGRLASLLLGGGCEEVLLEKLKKARTLGAANEEKKP